MKPCSRSSRTRIPEETQKALFVFHSSRMQSLTTRTKKEKKPMKRYLVGAVVAVASLTVGVLVVHAANVHLKGSLSSTDNGTTDTVCGKLTGLGNGDLTITLIGSGTRSS